DGVIQCPVVACSHLYAVGTTVTLEATPLTGFVFGGWSPSACSSGTVLMTVDRSCRAIFLPAVVGGPKPGSINLNGSGLGDAFTYNPRTGVRTSQFSDGLMHFGETRAGWPAGLSVNPADFNGDGLTDFLVYAPASGAWSKAINNGAGDFTYFSGPLWGTAANVYIV